MAGWPSARRESGAADAAAQSAPGSLPRPQIAGPTRFLVAADRRPFFWQGDTA